MSRSITRGCAVVLAGAASSALGMTGVSAEAAGTAAQPPRQAAAPSARVPGVRGDQLWVSRSTAFQGIAYAVAVSPDGSTVYVTGQVTAGDNSYLGTVAYRAATGTRLWAARYKGLGNPNGAESIAVGPGGGKVYVTGWSTGSGSQEDSATVAYNAVTGARLWVARYNGPGSRAGPPALAGRQRPEPLTAVLCP